MKTNVLTYCSGYPYEIFERFAGTLYDTGFQGKLIYFIKESDIPTLTNLIGEYPKVEYIVTESEFHVQSYRFVLYNDFLNSQDDDSNIFICDSRDVIFQKNIEDYPVDREVDLYFFREDKITRDCEYNTNYMDQINQREKHS